MGSEVARDRAMDKGGRLSPHINNSSSNSYDNSKTNTPTMSSTATYVDDDEHFPAGVDTGKMKGSDSGLLEEGAVHYENEDDDEDEEEIPYASLEVLPKQEKVVRRVIIPVVCSLAMDHSSG